VPFGFLKRKHPEQAQAGKQGAAPGSTAQGITKGGGARPEAGRVDASRLHRGASRGVAFTALTEDWRLRGRMEIAGRLSDALNRREAIAIDDVLWAQPGDAELEPAPGLKSVDPYDLILVTAGEDSLPPLSETERSALKVHKVSYDVALEVPPFRVIGTVFMHPGSEPDGLLLRGTDMFVPVLDARATLGETLVSEPDVDVILVNRFYLRGVEQVDRSTGGVARPLPGTDRPG
jgi:hypothetical protein